MARLRLGVQRPSAAPAAEWEERGKPERQERRPETPRQQQGGRQQQRQELQEPRHQHQQRQHHQQRQQQHQQHPQQHQHQQRQQRQQQQQQRQHKPQGKHHKLEEQRPGKQRGHDRQQGKHWQARDGGKPPGMQQHKRGAGSSDGGGGSRRGRSPVLAAEDSDDDWGAPISRGSSRGGDSGSWGGDGARGGESRAVSSSRSSTSSSRGGDSSSRSSRSSSRDDSGGGGRGQQQWQPLGRRLKGAASIDQVLQLLRSDSQGGSNPIHATVALEQGARLASSSSSSSSSSSGGGGGGAAAQQALAPLLQLLQPNLLVGLPDYPMRNLSGVAWACAKAGSLPLGSPLHSAICSAAGSKLADCQPRDLAQLCWALAMAAAAGSADAGPAAAGSTDAEAGAEGAAGAAAAGAPAALLQAMSSRAAELAADLEPHTLALLSWSLAQLQQPLPAQLLQALATAAPQLSPRQLCQAASACAALQIQVGGGTGLQRPLLQLLQLEQQGANPFLLLLCAALPGPCRQAHPTRRPTTASDLPTLLPTLPRMPAFCPARTPKSQWRWRPRWWTRPRRRACPSSQQPSRLWAAAAPTPCSRRA
jgi:hypothetical protein